MLSQQNTAEESKAQVRTAKVGMDWSVNKIVTCTHLSDERKKPIHRFEGADAEMQSYLYIKELVDEGYDVTAIYEAGRCGFTPARFMELFGAEVFIVPIGKLEMVVKGKKRKTDKLDARFLVNLELENTPRVWIPDCSVECKRFMLSERQNIRTRINRVNSEMINICTSLPLTEKEEKFRSAEEWEECMKVIRKETPAGLQEKLFGLERRIAELKVYEVNRLEIEERMDAIAEQERKKSAEQGVLAAMDKLMLLKGVGPVIARTLSWYVGDFSRFSNGKKFSSYCGLTGVPYSSGTTSRDQGISKAGNAQIRTMAVGLAWQWSRHQPNSPVTMKFKAKLEMKGRTRRTGIVAMARTLMVVFHKFIVHGEIPEGALFKDEKSRDLLESLTN